MVDDKKLQACLDAACQRVPPGSTWRHYRGDTVWVITVVLEESTLLPTVVYGHGRCRFSRTLASFLSGVETEGGVVPRFEPVE